MDVVVLPQALMIFYGALVLGCGTALGFIIGRNVRRLPSPSSPDDVDRRLRVLEEELELAQTEISSLREERDFLRRLSASPEPQREIPPGAAA